MSAPALSIVIPSQRRIDLLEQCLASVFRHRPAPLSLEVIVADDGSAAGCVSRTAQRFAEVRTLRHDQPRGFCAAVNAGLRAAAAPIVQLLNDDAQVTAGWCDAPLRRLRTDGNCAAVTPLILLWPGDRIDSAGDRYDPGGFAQKRGHGKRLSGARLVAGPAESVSGCGAFFRREALLAVGGFPEEFVAYFDDVDVSLRLRRAGHALWFEPDSRILHHGSASYGKRPGAKTLALQSRNEERLFWRHWGPKRRLPHLLRHLGVLAGKSWRRLEEGRFGPFLEGRLRAWADGALGS